MKTMTQEQVQKEEIEKIEADLLLESIYRYYGYDFEITRGLLSEKLHTSGS